MRATHIARLLVATLALATTEALALERKAKPVIVPADLARLVHSRVNAERKSHRLPQLTFDPALARIAEGHSRDMSARNYFAHSAPEGDGFAERYQRGGYPCAIRLGNVIHGGAENLALGHLFASITTVNGEAFYDWNSADAIAKKTVEGWMNSPGHRRNILTAHWGHEGIGIALAADGKVYVTQNFC